MLADSPTSVTRVVVTIVATIWFTCSLEARACGLEPALKGGFSISYPGSLDVAVAVAKARSDGLLPPPGSDAIPNEVRLHQLLSDLQRLQSRLNGGRSKVPNDSGGSFSFVLVGPGLWSHFYMTPSAVLANYHADGPLSGEAVVLTHSAVLRALLTGTMTVDRAEELGLLRYSGVDTDYIKQAFESGLQS